MPQNRDFATLLDIERSVQKIIRFTQGLDREIFLSDEKSQSAIVFQLIIIGEATKRLSIELRQQHPSIPWSLMAGMRDKLIHDYDEIDLSEVWKTANSDIPKLFSLIQIVLDR